MSRMPSGPQATPQLRSPIHAGGGGVAIVVGAGVGDELEALDAVSSLSLQPTVISAMATRPPPSWARQRKELIAGTVIFAGPSFSLPPTSPSIRKLLN